MDYELRRDLCGSYQATFSMGHEAFGVWLTEEIGSNQELIDDLITKIDQLQSLQCMQHHHTGGEFILTMNPEGIEVRAARLDDVEDEAPEELNHYDQESHAGCGLDDFHQLLIAWRDFTKSSAPR